MTPELKKCAENLMIQSVTLKNLLVQLHEDMDAEQFSDEILDNTQELRYLRQIRQSEKEENGVWSYRLNTVVAIRCISEEDAAKDDNENISEPLLEIKAEFIAQYESNCSLSEEEINQFGQKHVYYHVWPYWREILQSSCARLGISPIVIPPLRV
ncbi:hypothetical protein [Aliivibrio fischeri]|uniref:hypothetical protein n=1 Tax=Aliivibrio fischeri TaxID=668 RepID=UPI00080E3C49|nr:hypothetical protein [Aliivibrio fischeri]OCH42323.1 hypothetical protein A6D99_18925 [Aliivibrio fischeri]